MEKVTLNGGTPLPFCKHCLAKRISPPTINVITNFAEKAKETNTKRKRQLDDAVSKGHRKGRSNKK